MTDLTKLAKDEESVVIGLKGAASFSGRMASMGLTVGSTVKMLQNYGKGPLIIIVRDTRIALGRGEAAKIIVGEKPVEQKS
jgi:ferrous iron transport protein A